jgi:hypothetical protein
VSPSRDPEEHGIEHFATPGCLIVSPDPLRQIMFSLSARRSGWLPVLCRDQATVELLLETGAVGVALIDIASKHTNENVPDQRGSLVETVASHREVLTVICGHSHRPQEETWAREQAAWMYLPGVAPETDLRPILRAALELWQRRSKEPFNAPSTPL